MTTIATVSSLFGLLVWLAQIAGSAPAGPAGRHPPALPPPPALVGVAKALNAHETARYRIGFGGLDVGQATMTVAGRRTAKAGETIRTSERAEGSVLGLGHFTWALDGEFDPVRLQSRRWMVVATSGDRRSRVSADQERPGYVTLDDSEPDSSRRLATFMRGEVVDPLGFLLRLRARPPAPGGSPMVMRLLAGRYLWRVTIRNQGRAEATLDGRSTAVTRFEGRMEPVFYDGTAARDGRSAHTLVVDLEADDRRLPVQFEVGLDVGTLTFRLSEVDRGAPARPEKH